MHCLPADSIATTAASAILAPRRSGALRVIARSLVASIALTWGASAATAAPDKAKPITIDVRKGKGKIGSESLRSKTGEANGYHSTSARLSDGGRTFTQRAHLVLDAKGVLQTYDRWIDVKGATLRIRVFQHEGKWKHVLFGQPGEKNQVTDLDAQGNPVVFDERSPTINGLAALLAAKREKVWFIRADEPSSAEATITREALTDAAGKAFARTTFTAKKFTIAVVRDADGRVVHVAGPGEFGGSLAGFDPKKLTVSAAPAAADIDAKAPPTTQSDDAAPPPPRDDPQGTKP